MTNEGRKAELHAITRTAAEELAELILKHAGRARTLAFLSDPDAAAFMSGLTSDAYILGVTHAQDIVRETEI